MTHSPAGRAVIVIMAVGIVAAVWVVMRGGMSAQQAPAPGDGSGAGTSPAPGPAVAAESPAAATKASPRPGPADPPDEGLEDHVEALAGAATAEAARESLAELETWLRSLRPGAAAPVIRGFLESGRDVSLPLEFRIGPGGFLETPPTLRVALLDLLGRLDPEAAAALGKDILSTPTNADEWAVALRDVARIDEDGSERNYLRAKTEELIRNETWQANPSVGYLNAFDVLVHTRATESTPLLSELIRRKDRRDLAHAGYLTLDRLTQRAPVEVLERLRADGPLRESRPGMVAQQFARADLREPAQRELVRTWLLAPERTPGELHAFAGIFPNNNRMISTNLLTTETPPSGVELRAHDVEVLSLVSRWQQDPAFARVRPHLDTMVGRLRQFTAGRAPLPAAPAP
ncbi:MAG: hypothetical protein HKN82_18535 [Akkermansiaceae bacterium]|nr:hypothetical protein [Akkermansiaceae bacterium]